MGHGRNEQRFESLYADYYHRVSGYILRRVHDRQDAADALSEVFLVAWRRLDEVPTGAEGPWLIGVARRVLSNQRRGSARLLALRERLAHELDSLTIDRPAPTEFAAAVSEGLARLSASEREVLRLAAWEGLTDAGIAQVLGCSPGAARVRLHRARSRLRAQLDQPEADPTPRESAWNAVVAPLDSKEPR